MHFPSRIKEFLLTPFMNLFFHFTFAFLSRNVHFLLRRGSDLHTPPWQWLLVRWDINNPPPFLGHDLLHGFRDFLTLSCFNFFKDTIEFLVFCVRSLSVEKQVKSCTFSSVFLNFYPAKIIKLIQQLVHDKLKTKSELSVKPRCPDRVLM